MKNQYLIIIYMLLSLGAQAQTFDFSINYIGINESTDNHQLALIATPSNMVTNGVTADMGAGFYIPSGLAIGNFVSGNSGIPISEWSVQSLGSSDINGDPYFVSRVEAGSSSIELNGDGPFELVLFDIIASPNPNSGSVTFVENGDPIFDEILFVQNYININLGSGTIDAYNQNDSSANSVDFSTLSLPEKERFYDITIYPNPVRDILNVNLKIDADYEIIDINGKIVLSGTMTLVESLIDMSKVNSGIYFLNLKSIEGSVIKKIIKE